MNWWSQVVSLEFRKFLTYRVEFWVTFLGQTLVQLVIARSLWGAVFEMNETSEMRGFTLPMLTLYYLIVPIGSRILTGENIGFLSREIYDGTFSRYLLYPLSWFQYKTLTYFSYSLFYTAQLVLLFVIYQLAFGGGLTGEETGHMVLGAGLFLLSSLIYLLLAICVELVSLWADNVWSLMIVLRFFSNFLGGAFIPIAFFPEWAQKTLGLLPFANLVSLPTRAMMGMATSSEVLRGLTVLGVWAILLGLMARFIWHRGEKRYTGVGI